VAVARFDIAVTPTAAAQTCVDFDIGISFRKAPPAKKLTLCAPSTAVVRRQPAPSPSAPPMAKYIHLSHGKIDATAGFDAPIVRRYVQRSSQKIVACYENTPTAKPGTVTLSFEIGNDGRANGVSATGIPGVDTCIADVIKTLEFPKPNGFAHVDY